MDDLLEVTFEVGDQIKHDVYPLNFGFQVHKFAPNFVTIMDGDQMMANYHLDRVICIRRHGARLTTEQITQRLYAKANPEMGLATTVGAA